MTIHMVLAHGISCFCFTIYYKFYVFYFFYIYCISSLLNGFPTALYCYCMQLRDAEVLLPEPGEQIRPSVSLEDAQQIVTSEFGLHVLQIKHLNSYEDKNFFLQVSASHYKSQMKELWPHGYTLKILNSLESQKPEFTIAQNELLEYLHRRNFSCPIPISNIKGEYYFNMHFYPENTEKAFKTAKEDHDVEPPLEKCHLIRLLTYIPGLLLSDVDCTPEIFFKVGLHLAKLHKILQNFYHSAFDMRKTIWSLDCLPSVARFLSAVKDTTRQSLVYDVIAAFSDRVLPIYSRLPQGLIHGDYNEQNILVEPQYSSTFGLPNSYRVNGILDFADVQKSCLVFDVAIGLAYIMMMNNHNLDPIDAAGYFLAGYVHLRPLTNAEWQVIKICVAARFCQSLVLGIYNHSMDPRNDYILVTQKKGWEIFEEMWPLQERDLNFRWQNIIKSFDIKSNAQTS